MLTKGKKTKTIKDTQRHAEDTGSPEVQIALLTKKIEELTKHLKKNLKDKHSRRGLLQMVADRRSNMNYLQKKDPRKFNALMKKLGMAKKV
jgi:small subunit ribosomal protein S15